MANDRPLFDDEELPDWLKSGGVTHGGAAGQTADPQASGGDLPWLNERPSDSAALSAETPPWMEADTATQGAQAETTPPWMQDLAPAEAASTAPSSGVSPFGDVGEQDLDWSQPQAEEPVSRPPGFGGTGALPSRQDAPDEQDQAPESSGEAASWDNVPAQPLASGHPDDDLSWLQDASPAAEQPQQAEEPPATPKGIRRLPTQSAETPSAAPAQPTPAQPAAEQPAKPIRKLPKTETGTSQQVSQQPAASAAPRGPIKKLPPRPPDLSNMTYEEWERLQIANEQEAQSDPADKLLEQVPDWISGTGAPPPPPDSGAPGATGPEFMPDWFMGMDEQSQDAAPDWFRNADLSGTSLVGPETVQTPTAAPGASGAPGIPPAASAEDVPDWFKGAGVEGLDFNAMFGAQPAPTEPEPPSPPPPAPQPRASQTASQVPTEPPPQPRASQTASQVPVEPAPLPASEPEPATDWMSDLPDLDSLVGEPDQAAGGAAMPMDWLAEQSPEPAVEADLVDWMTTESAGGDVGAAATQAEPAQADIPSWMDELAPADQMPAQMPPMGAPPSSEPQPALEEDSGVPAWMRDMAPTEPAHVAPKSEPTPELDWLADVHETAMPTAPAAPTAQPTAASDADWLASVESTLAAPASPFSTDLGSSGNVDIDKLLSLTPSAPSAGPMVPVPREEQALGKVDDFDLDELLGPAPGEQQTAAEAIDLDELAAGLPSQDIGEEGPPRAGRLHRVPPAPAPAQEGPKAREELPEWIAEMRPSEAPVALRIGDLEVRLPERPQVRLTDQLRQLRDRARALTGEHAGEPAPEVGPLAGISGAIEAIPFAVDSPGTLAGAAPVITDLQARRVQIIQKVLASEEELLHQRAEAEDELAAQEAVARRRVRSGPKIDRLLITLFLAAIVVAPFFTGALNLVVPPDTTKLTDTQQNVASAIDSLPSGQPVLVAFEYGPTGSGELDDLARIVIRDIVKRGARPVIVSTNPSGAMHAQSLMASLGNNPEDLVLMQRTGKALTARQDYVLLRYLAGGAAGVRALVNAFQSLDVQRQVVFATDLQGKPTGLTDADLASLASNPAFVLTESAEDVRNWIEQYQVRSGQALPIVLLSSAGASAVAETYARSAPDKHIIGPLVGLRDSIVYRAVRQPQPRIQQLEMQRWQSVGLGLLLASVVILLGAAINLIRSLKRRERR
jgi:hypothetical protein